MIKGTKHTIEARKKMSEKTSGKKHPNWRKSLSVDTRKKIGDSHKGKKCYWFGRHRSEEEKRKISVSSIGRIVGEETRNKISKAKTGRPSKLKGKKRCPFSNEWKDNISKGNTGRKLSEETKTKIRQSVFEYAKKMGGFTCPTIGRHEKELLDELEQKLGYRIIRQYKVGGYFIDGYIPEINLAIEVDEKYHENRKKKDIKREEFIKQKLGCQFLRIKDYD